MKSLIERVKETPEEFDFSIEDLGECTIESPLEHCQFSEDSEHISFF